MKVVDQPAGMQETVLRWKREGVTTALVPTMGFLHEGHLSLIRIARASADRVVLSLFVNPTQFGPQEDLDRYPRAVERDLELCRKEGVDVVFLPESGSMYADNASVTVQEDRLSLGLCGGSRPGHFTGVLTVVAKLFNICLPEVSVFGEKDAQQIRLIRRMVRDLNFPVEILSGPIVREPDGVAMSSRNSNLSPEERQQAPIVQKALQAVRVAHAQGEHRVSILRDIASAVIAESDLAELDYLEMVDDESLEPVERTGSRAVLVAIAVRFPGARLIDNLVLA
jgi:pantoate--beta-alanine ligase